MKRNIEVQIIEDGKVDSLSNYILIKPKGTEVELFADCLITDYIIGLFTLYDTFAEEAKKYSDQDLYELCKTMEIDYDTVRRMIREASNGQNRG